MADATIAADASEYLTVPEVAALLRVHENSVRRWVRAGGIPHTRVGLKILFPAALIRSLLADAASANRPAFPTRPAVVGTRCACTLREEEVPATPPP